MIYNKLSSGTGEKWPDLADRMQELGSILLEPHTFLKYAAKMDS
jgi:hypothetical protein